MAVTQGGRSLTGVTAMPRKLECFGQRSYKKLRDLLTPWILDSASQRPKKTAAIVHTSKVRKNADQSSAGSSPDVWPLPHAPVSVGIWFHLAMTCWIVTLKDA